MDRLYAPNDRHEPVHRLPRRREWEDQARIGSGQAAVPLPQHVVDRHRAHLCEVEVDLHALRLVHGVGERKLNAFGPVFVKAIAEFLGKPSPL